MRRFAILFAAVLVLVSGCRTDQPPKLSIICTLDGFGGGDCALPDGTRKYLTPSEMKGFWATTQVDEANYSSWCYKTPVPVVTARMAEIQAQMTGGPLAVP